MSPNSGWPKGKPQPEETKQKIRETMRGMPNISWGGGEVGKAYYRILFPLGYIWEHQVDYGEPDIPMPNGGFRCHWYVLDFALVENKINIELDGPKHHSEGDDTRDAYLRENGWKVIRIKYDQEHRDLFEGV